MGKPECCRALRCESGQAGEKPEFTEQINLILAEMKFRTSEWMKLSDETDHQADRMEETSLPLKVLALDSGEIR